MKISRRSVVGVFSTGWTTQIGSILKLMYVPMLFFAISVIVTWARFTHPYGLSLEDDMNGTFPLYSLLADCYRNGQIPLWNPYSFTGASMIPSMQGIFYPANILFCFLSTEFSIPLILCLHKLITAGGLYLYLRRFRFPTIACFGGGVVLMLCGFFTGQARHFSIINATAWLPWLFLGWEYLRNGRKSHAYVLLAGTLALMILAGRAETAVRSALFLGAYAMLRPAGRLRMTVFWLVGICVLTLLLTMCVISPVVLGIRGTGRETMSYTLFCEASLPFQALIELLIPRFYGSDLPGWYKNSYWGSVSPWETASYVGLLPLALGLATVIRRIRRDSLVRIWAILAGLALLLALGQHTPLHFLTYHVPGLNRFRAAARFMAVFDLAFAVLFAITLREMVRQTTSIVKLRWYNLVAWGLIGLSSLLAAAIVISRNMHASFFAGPVSKFLNGRPEQIQALFNWTEPAIMLPLVTALACGITMLALARFRRRALVPMIILCLTTVDLAVFAATFDGTSKLAKALADAPLATEIMPPELQAAMRNARMISMSPWTNYSRSLMLPNTNVAARVRSLNGYYPLTALNFRNLFGITSTTPISVASFLLYENRLISTFGVEYLVGWDQQLGGAIRTWDWGDWAADERQAKRYTDLSPLAILSGAQWENGHGTLQKSNSDVPVLVFTVPNDGLSAFRCRFMVRATEVPDKHLSLLVATGGKPKTILGQHAISCFDITSEFLDHQFSFVNPGRDAVELHFYTHSSGPIEIESLLIEEISVPNTVKISRNAEGLNNPSPYEIVHTFQTMSSTNDPEAPRFCIARNRNAAPLVYLARRILPVDGFDEASRILTDTDSDFCPGVDAIVERPDNAVPMSSEGGAARIVEDSINHVEVDCRSDGRSLLVFLDSYEEGWSATVNGMPAKIYKTNGLTKGVLVPSGHSVVRFEYFPPGLSIGLAVTTAGMIFCIGVLVFPYIARFPGRQNG